jgi:hypothetical protein
MRGRSSQYAVVSPTQRWSRRTRRRICHIRKVAAIAARIRPPAAAIISATARGVCPFHPKNDTWTRCVFWAMKTISTTSTAARSTTASQAKLVRERRSGSFRRVRSSVRPAAAVSEVCGPVAELVALWASSVIVCPFDELSVGYPDARPPTLSMADCGQWRPEGRRLLKSIVPPRAARPSVKSGRAMPPSRRQLRMLIRPAELDDVGFSVRARQGSCRLAAPTDTRRVCGIVWHPVPSSERQSKWSASSW